MSSTPIHTTEDTLVIASESIMNFLRLILELFDEFGIEGLHELTNPSLDELEQLIKDFQHDVDKLQTQNDLSLENKRISLAQGLLYASLMLAHVKDKNHHEVDFNRKQLGLHT